MFRQLQLIERTNQLLCSAGIAGLCLLLMTGCQTFQPASSHKSTRPVSGKTAPATLAEMPVPASGSVPAMIHSNATVLATVREPTRPAGLDGVRLRPGLVISMSVLVAGKKEIEETGKRITDRGTVALPLLGTLPVDGLNLDEFSRQLTERYRTYFVNPQVLVEFVRDIHAEGISPWGYVTVLGRVRNPGRIALPATRDLTVSGGIQRAGGFNTSARTDAILITRRAPDGTSQTREVDLNAVGADGRIEDDIVVESDDVVYVPESRF